MWPFRRSINPAALRRVMDALRADLREEIEQELTQKQAQIDLLEYRLEQHMRHVEDFSGYPCDAAWGPPTLLAYVPPPGAPPEPNGGLP